MRKRSPIGPIPVRDGVACYLAATTSDLPTANGHPGGG